MLSEDIASSVVSGSRGNLPFFPTYLYLIIRKDELVKETFLQRQNLFKGERWKKCSCLVPGDDEAFGERRREAPGGSSCKGSRSEDKEVVDLH